MPMKPLLAAVTVTEIEAFVAEFEQALSDGTVTTPEAQALRRRLHERVAPVAKATHAGTVLSQAMERGAVDPGYIADLAKRFRLSVEALPEPLGAA